MNNQSKEQAAAVVVAADAGVAGLHDGAASFFYSGK
jgi:hypothetical protein